MLVFGAATWVGTAEENPEELPLPMPEAIKQMQKPVQTTLDFSKAVGAVADEAVDTAGEPGWWMW